MCSLEVLRKLAASIRADHDSAWEHFGEWLSAMEQRAQPMETDEETHYYEILLNNSVSCLEMKIALALEIMGASSMLQEFKAEILKAPKSTEVEVIPYVSEPVSERLNYLWKYCSLVFAFAEDNCEDHKHRDLPKLERILKGSAKIIKDSNLDPKKETDVSNHIKKVVSVVYPDTQTVSFSGVFRRFLPEFGVPSLKAVVEYKFVDSDEEVRKVIGEIFEDMVGYSSDGEWEVFYVVFYMTDAFMTEDQVEQEWQRLRNLKSTKHLVENWKPILVTGRGGRIKA